MQPLYPGKKSPLCKVWHKIYSVRWAKLRSTNALPIPGPASDHRGFERPVLFAVADNSLGFFQSYAIQRLRQLFGAGAVNADLCRPDVRLAGHRFRLRRRGRLHIFFIHRRFAAGGAASAPVPLPQNQNARGHQCFYSIFHADISLCVDSKVTIASVRMVDKRQITEMERAAKAAP